MLKASHSNNNEYVTDRTGCGFNNKRAARRGAGFAASGPAGGMGLTGEIFDALVQMYEHTGFLGGYELREGLPTVTIAVERRRGGGLRHGAPLPEPLGSGRGHHPARLARLCHRHLPFLA